MNRTRSIGAALTLAAVFSGCLSGAARARYSEAEVEFSRPGGFFDKSFTVSLSCGVPGAVIKYTLNSSSPSETNGTVYAAPIEIKTTAVIRAAAYKKGADPSRVATRTYIFPEDVTRQSKPKGRPLPTFIINDQAMDFEMDPGITGSKEYGGRIVESLLSIPSVSLVTDDANLFDERTGVYVNPLDKGKEWERPVSVEFLAPGGGAGAYLRINAGLRIRGGWSRVKTDPKHSLRLVFKEEYGGRLEQPLFGGEGVKTFAKIDLSTSQNYAWAKEGDGRNTMVRELFSRDVMGAMGQPYTRSRFVHVYLNGWYWGVYTTQERADAFFAQTYFGGDRKDYDVVNVDCGPDSGDFGAYRELWAAAMKGFETDEKYRRVLGQNPDGSANPAFPVMVDEANLIDYMLTVYYTGNFDTPVTRFRQDLEPNNFYAVYDRKNPAGWKFIMHDAEHAMFDLDEDRTFPVVIQPEFKYFNPGYLHQKLMEHPEYRMKFVDRAYKRFYDGGVFVPENAARLLRKRVEEVGTAMIAESARWGDARGIRTLTHADWRKEIDYLLQRYIPARRDIVVRQLKGGNMYPGVEPPGLSGGGAAKYPRVVAIVNPGNKGDVYYTLDGGDPRARGGKTAPGASSGEGEIRLTAPATIKARVKFNEEWSALVTESW